MSTRELSPRSIIESQYWTGEVDLAEGFFFGMPFTIQGRIHVGNERHGRVGDREIVQVRRPVGCRTSVQLEPYIELPDFGIDVGLGLHDAERCDQGSVIDLSHRGLKRQPIGSGQASVFPEDQLIFLRDVALHPSFGEHDLLADHNLTQTWLGFERFLTDRFPDCTRVETPGWNSEKESVVWQEFLSELGYERLNERAFAKGVTSS
jgi:hypothetical protein